MEGGPQWWPSLYKFDAKGKVRVWKCGLSGVDHTFYVTEYGSVNTKTGELGKMIMTAPKKINANARVADASVQARNYAQQQWDEKQRKDAYYPSDFIPTCSKEEWLEQHSDNRKWPALCKAWGDLNEVQKDCSPQLQWFTQFKVDGNRVTAWYQDGELKLYSRTCQELKFKDHIREQLTGIFQLINFCKSGGEDDNHYVSYNFGLDGEIWNPKNKFHQQSHSVASRTVNKSELDEEQCFAWFDIIDYELSFDKRTKLISEVKDVLLEFDDDAMKTEKVISMNQSDLCIGGKMKNIFIVPTQLASDIQDCFDAYENATTLGFEGLVLRRPTHMYPRAKNIRHADMVKMKPYEDSEFEVIGFKSASGDREFCVVWEVRNDINNSTFTTQQMGDLEFQRELYANASSFIGKKLTIRFTERSAEGIPKQPRAKLFRPDWDLDIEDN